MTKFQKDWSKGVKNLIESAYFSHNSAILKKQLGFFAVTIGFV